ncbi:MAG: hypothetical protein R3B53_04655 [Candidatus Paceibacterota bacterium]
MNFLKRFYTWEKKQMKNPETVLSVWITFGVLLGIGIDNVGAGIAIGVAIGIALYTNVKNNNK